MVDYKNIVSDLTGDGKAKRRPQWRYDNFYIDEVEEEYKNRGIVLRDEFLKICDANSYFKLKDEDRLTDDEDKIEEQEEMLKEGLESEIVAFLQMLRLFIGVNEEDLMKIIKVLQES